MTTDPLPWRHETGSRHANDYDAPAGVVFWMPRDNNEQTRDATIRRSAKENAWR